MLVLADEAFERHGIERKNQRRVVRERAAQSARHAAPAVTNRRVDTSQPFTPGNAPRLPRSSSKSGGGGGGSFSPIAALLIALFAGITARCGRSRYEV